MILLIIVIAVVLIVAAFRNSQGALFSALATDVPPFAVWGAAVFAIGAIGYIPGLKPVSQGLLALVILVIVLHNYENILQGFEAVSTAQTATNTSAQGTNNGATSSTATNAAGSFLSSVAGTGSNDAESQEIGSAIEDTGIPY